MKASGKEFKRDREANWSLDERKCLRNLASNYVKVLNDRRNDVWMTAQKKDAWEHIREQMLALGYRRGISRLKQQWSRMKSNSKAKASAVRKATVKIENPSPIPDMDLTATDEDSMSKNVHEEESAISRQSPTINNTSIIEELQKKQLEKLKNEMESQKKINAMKVAHLKELHEKQLQHINELHELKKQLLLKLINESM